ncbi:MAG: ATP-binding cassette domain-containing protein, partial [Spirochaetota bacterium]
MVFSYTVQEHVLLENIEIPLEQGKLLLITGIENTPLRLLGGILAGTFPVPNEDTLPHLSELIKYFSGKLQLHNGQLPQSAVYMGPDPEKHLLFSRVDEEIYAQTGLNPEHLSILHEFGVDRKFLRRRIATLSGGEKMKLALAIIFAKSADLIVLHGVLPWLDKHGKFALLNAMDSRCRSGACIVIIEQEIDLLLHSADVLFYFDGRKLLPYSTALRKVSYSDIAASAEKLFAELSAAGTGAADRDLLTFESVSFRYPETPKEQAILINTCFSLKHSCIYSLIGDNGTGKSTIAKLILRLFKPDSGRISLFNSNLKNIPRETIVRSVCYLGQFPEQYITLSSVEQYKNQSVKNGNKLAELFLKRYFPEEKPYPIATLTPLQLKLLSLAASVYS